MGNIDIRGILSASGRFLFAMAKPDAWGGRITDRKTRKEKGREGI